MDLFRSESMQLVQIIIPNESAHRTIDYLGEIGLIQFKDVRFLISILFSFFRDVYLCLMYSYPVLSDNCVDLLYG